MNSSQHDRAGEILLQALDLPSNRRTEFVKRACGDDRELCDEVRSLLAASSDSLPLVDSPGQGAAVMAGDTEEALIGRSFGAYRIRRRIAIGGMGVVYEAEQRNPRRVVALKIMRREMTSRSAVRRFQFEVQALARLRHAGIAQVYDAGVHEERDASIPYFAMEYVQGGGSIISYADERQLGMRERLALMARVCDAVHYGHQQGIIHRDLKPENVLVDTTGQPKVIDFGVARARDAEAPLTTRHTGVVQIVGTLAYMSPEQLAGDPDKVDTRTDVYALGVILYQLLTGRLTVEVELNSLVDAVNALRDTEPRKLGSIDRAMRGDVETIVAKALEKEKTRRYQSATELAADIRRFLKDEPIGARPPTTMYQLRKFARRNRGLVIGGTIAVIALLAGAGIAIQQAFVARQEEANAQHQAYLASVAAAATALQNHDIRLARRSLERAPVEHRGWEWHHLRSRLDQSVLVIPGDARPPGSRIRFLDDRVIGAWDERDRRWNRWDADSGAPLSDSGPTPYLDRNQNGTGLFSIDGDVITVRDLVSGATQHVDLGEHGIPLTRGWRRLNLSNNRRLLSFNNTRMAVLIDLATGESVRTKFSSMPSGATAAAVNDFGQVALAGALNGMPAIWDAASGKLRPLRGATALGVCVAFSPDGMRVVGGLSDSTVQLWDARTGESLAVGRGHRNTVSGVAFSPDETTVASVSNDRTVRLWDDNTLAPLGVLDGHGAEVVGLRFRDDGEQLLTIGRGRDSAIRVWDVTSRGDPTILRGHSSYVYPVAVSPNGAIIASGGWDNTIRLWDADNLTSLGSWSGCTDYLLRLSFSPDGSRLLSVSGKNTLRIWDVATGGQIRQIVPEAPARWAAFCSDSVHIYLPHDHVGPITLWNAVTGECVEHPIVTLRSVKGPSVSADGRFAVIDGGSQNRLIRTRDGRPVLSSSVGSVFAFSPAFTGRRFTDIDPDAPCDVRVWNLETGTQMAKLQGHTGRTVFDIVFTPDGSRIVTAGDDQIIRVWDAVTFDEIVPLAGHRAYVWSLAFRPDGTQLVSGSGDGTVRVWDTIPFAQRRASADGP